MSMNGAIDLETRKVRWREFLRPDAGYGFMFHVDYPMSEADLPAKVLPIRANANARVERAWTVYQTQCRRAARVPDDRIPSLSNMGGTEIFAEAFGCRLHLPAGSHPCAIPFIHTAEEADALRVPELSTSSLAYLFDIADELYRRGGPGAVMSLVDVQSPMDIAALIWDKSDFFVAMMDTPEQAVTLAERLNEFRADREQ